MKKIISPQDLSDQNVTQVPAVPVMPGAAEEVPAAGVNIDDTDGVGDEGCVQQQCMRQDETVAAGDCGMLGDSVQPGMQSAGERVDSQTRSPGRPQRIRKPNVKYSQEEYDLTAISAHSKQARISGISVGQYEGYSGVNESRTLGLATSHGFRTGGR